MPKSNEFWVEALAPTVPWQIAYATVEREAREYLTNLPAPRLSTSGLVEALFPVMSTRGAGIKARNRIFLALKALAKHTMKDCAQAVPGHKTYFGRQTKPLIWTRPAAKCIFCNGTGLEQ